MITDTTADFNTALAANSRSPVLLAQFMLPNKTYYVSDCIVGSQQGLSHDYSPFVENWGTLKDLTSIDDALNWGSLEVRSGTLTLIDCSESNSFITDLIDAGIENTEVKIYQWFEGLADSDKNLIDIFVCQDPLVLEEKSTLLKVDIVSVIMETNNFLTVQRGEGLTRDIVVGRADAVPLIDMKTHPYTKLTSPITATFTGVVLVDNGVGIPANSSMYIDTEVVNVTTVTAATINISARGVRGTTARSHSAGAVISVDYWWYDYEVCAGPVKSLANLKGDGETYVNPWEAFPDNDPVFIRFWGLPPWIKVSTTTGTPITPADKDDTFFGSNYENTFGDGAVEASGPQNINEGTGLIATMAITNKVGGADYSTTLTKTISSSLPRTEDNLYQTKPGDWQDKIHLGPTYLELETLYSGGVWTVTNANIQGAVFWYSNDDHSSLGTLLTCALRVDYSSACQCRRADIYVKVEFVYASGSTLILEEETLYNYEDAGTGPGSIVYASFANTVKNYSISISSFADLIGAGIKLTFKCIRGLITDDWNSYTKGVITINHWYYDVTYHVAAGTVQYPWTYLYSIYNRDDSGLGTLKKVEVMLRSGCTTWNGTTIDYQMVYKADSSSTPTVLENLTEGDLADTGYHDLSITDWAVLQTAEVGIYLKVTGPTADGSERAVNVSFSKVEWKITYTPTSIQTPNEVRVVLATSLTVDVESLDTATVTPPTAIYWLLMRNLRHPEYVDLQNFLDKSDEYFNLPCIFGGLLPGTYRFLDALRHFLREACAHLKFSQGKIKLLNWVDDWDVNPEHTIPENQIFLKSRRLENKPTSAVINDLTYNYAKNLTTGEYEITYNDTDNESISKYGLHQEYVNFDLISSGYGWFIQLMNWIRMYKWRAKDPVTLMSVDIFMPSGYILEKDDVIIMHDFRDRTKQLKGRVLSMERTFASGKTKQMNKFKAIIANPEEYTP